MNEQTLNPAIANPTGQNTSKPLDAPEEVMPSTPAPNEAEQPPSTNNEPLTDVTAKRPISEARLAANRANAQKSTGPRTPEGKQRSCMNATRHAILGQVLHLTGKDLTAYNEFTSAYLKTLQPKGAVETQLANTCADLQFRLHRIAAAEHNLFALGHEENGDSIETGHPESHAALTFAETLRRSKDPITTITLYEQRLSRRFLQTLKQLREIQAERRALEQQQLDEMYIIARLHPSEAETIQPAHLGFVCSSSDWKQYLKRRILLESRQPGADKWPKPFNSRKFIRKIA